MAYLRVIWSGRHSNRVVAVIVVFVALWKSSSVLRNAVTDAWNAISSAVGDAIHAVIGFLQDLWNEAQSILAPLVPLFKTHGIL